MDGQVNERLSNISGIIYDKCHVQLEIIDNSINVMGNWQTKINFRWVTDLKTND